MAYRVMAMLLRNSSRPAPAGGNGRAGQDKSERYAACHRTEGKVAAPVYRDAAGQHAPYRVQA
ncbi:cytochrome C [Erwinia amylovora]|uniref:cytochrome C n=1 Tax=Erwinia amylovora TaxID=552 RepID=UPI00039E3E42|nr:cytochrome C [Erwinia amylovora]